LAGGKITRNILSPVWKSSSRASKILAIEISSDPPVFYLD